MKSYRFPIFLLAGILGLAAISCSLATGLKTTPDPQKMPPDLTAETPQANAATESPELPPVAEAPPAAAGCDDAVCVVEGTFSLARPIGPDGRDELDASARYGTLNKNTREMYHGVQFLNSTGTAVLAAADGTVVAAGDDSRTTYGIGLNSYGNLVILEHSLPGISEPVYTLYAHLSEVGVEAGDEVKLGQQIGLVGMSGSVSGSTLYFEVRLGENTYDATRNPELWLVLLPDDTGATTGVLSGRILNRDGEYLGIPNILVEPVQKSVQALIKTQYLKTYLEKNARGLSPWQESFAASNLPEGSYQISFYVGSKLYQRVVEVQPGLVTFVTFMLK